MDGSAVNEAQLNRVVQHLVDSSKGLSTMQEQLYNVRLHPQTIPHPAKTPRAIS